MSRLVFLSFFHLLIPLFLMIVASEITAAAGPGAGLCNPVISGDWSDPGVTRVGRDYYSLRSSFGWMPGLPIVHSKDLVHWEYIGCVFKSHPSIRPGTTGEGVWGSEIDYNPNSKTFVVYAPIGGTICAYTSKNPGGPYSGPFDLKIAGIDPGFFADDDGKLYLVYDEGKILELAPDGMSVKRSICDIGHGIGVSFEGPDIFKHAGYYYCLYSTGGTRPHQHSTVCTLRSRTIAGPWEPDPNNPQLQADDVTKARFQGPAHGTLVDTPDGRWFVTYHAHELSHYSLGRQMCIEPVEWTADGWWRPIHGRIPSETPDGEPVYSLADSDEFDRPELGLQWFFNAPPDLSGACWSLTEKPGRLRIKTQPGDIASAASLPCVFLQRVTKKAFSVSTRLEFDAESGQEAAGLHFFHDPGMSLWLVSTVRHGKKTFEVGKYDNGKRTSLFVTPNTIGKVVYLKIEVDHRETARFYYSRDGSRWAKLGGSIYFGDSWQDLRDGAAGSPDLGWVGPKRRNVWTATTMGVFAVRDGSDASRNADFNWFRVR